MKRTAHFRISDIDEFSERAKTALLQVADERDNFDWVSWSNVTVQKLRGLRNCGRKTIKEIIGYALVHASVAQAKRLERELRGDPTRRWGQPLTCPHCKREIP